jgi:predicted PurR-regulated permease PerM
MVAASYPLLDVFWTMFVFFLIAAFLWLLFRVFSDIFRRHDISGGKKALWLIFTIALPWLGAFVYILSQNDGMSRRDLERDRAAQARVDAQIRAAAHDGQSSAEQIAQAQKLLDMGAIDYSEFEQLKQRALA